MKINLSILAILAIFSMGCKSSKCGNTQLFYGKYSSKTNNETELYLILKKDGTFINHYKNKLGKVTEYRGKWKIHEKDCTISLKLWKNLGPEGPKHEPLIVSARFEDNKIQPYQDLPIYVKEKEHYD